MKECYRCGVELPLAAFYRNPGTSDGRLGQCRACQRAQSTAYRRANIELIREKDRARSKSKIRKAYDAEKQRRKRATTPGMQAAHNAIARAIRDGSIIRPEHCQLCKANGEVEGHHDDYAKRLDVLWLCPVCHAARHVQLGRLRTVGKIYGPDIELGF